MHQNRDLDKSYAQCYILGPTFWIRCIEQCSCFRSSFLLKGGSIKTPSSFSLSPRVDFLQYRLQYHKDSGISNFHLAVRERFATCFLGHFPKLRKDQLDDLCKRCPKTWKKDSVDVGISDMSVEKSPSRRLTRRYAVA